MKDCKTAFVLPCRLWDVAAGTCVRELKFASKIRSVAFQADGAYMIAGGDDGDVSVWSVADAKQLLNVPCHGSISSVTCNSRRNVVAAASSRSKQIYIITILMT